MGPAKGAGVVEERRIGEYGVERTQLQGGEALGDVTGDRRHPVLHLVQLGPLPRQFPRPRIPLQPPEPCARPPRGGRQQHRARPAADVEHPLARLRVAGGGQQGRIHARAVALGRLQQPHPPAQQAIFGDRARFVGGWGGDLAHGAAGVP